MNAEYGKGPAATHGNVAIPTCPPPPDGRSTGSNLGCLGVPLTAARMEELPKKLPLIQKETGELTKAIMELSEVVGEAIDRFSPVISADDEPGKAQLNPVPEYSCSLANFLNEKTQRILSIKGTLRSALDRCEL